MSAGVELDHVTVRFGEFTAVDDATLDIKGGEFFSFLGLGWQDNDPAHRLGFLEPSRRGGEDRWPEHGRDRAQQASDGADLPEHAVPLMTVAENITYGLRVRASTRRPR